ncbi:MAG: hypothetical protein GXY81_02150 [Candidatus Cloacimonetes bacterium]|nr:hypothetical protein [Candidatus Cloacimonadota bacterium]
MKNTFLSRILPLLTLLLLLLPALNAQSNREEYELLKSFALPKAAIPASDITQLDGVWLKDGKAFTGIAFNRFENGQLSRVFSLLRGLQNGPMYLWYPDGAPQMSANYRQGRLDGRFLGWYHHGAIIYDMVINASGYAGDYIERDGGGDADDIFEREGDTADSRGD